MNDAAAAILGRSRLFSTLDDDHIRRILASSPTVKIPGGKTIFSKGEPPDAVYVVLNGEIAIEIISPQGRSVRVATLKEGAVFGELAALDGGMRTADARASQNAELLRIGKSAFQDLIAQAPAFARAIIGDLIEKLRMTDDQIENISFKPLKPRLAGLLLTLAGDVDAAAPAIPITQAALAERLTATREKVNIHLQVIQRAGAIRLKRGKIDILDQDKLRAFADED